MNTIEQLWYVVYTKPKHEKTVEKNLSEQSFETFLPLIKKHKKWSDRKKWVTFPLFKSYVFVHSISSKIQEVLATKGIVKLVKFNKSPAIIKKNEINNIKIKRCIFLSIILHLLSPLQKLTQNLEESY